MFFTKHGYEGNTGECQELGGGDLPGETDEGGEQEEGGVEDVGPAHDAHHGLHVKGVAAEQAAGQQAHQSGVRGSGLPGESFQEEI